MNNQTDTQDTYPPLPEPAITSYQTDSVMRVRELHTFNAAQMRAYVDADRTLRAGQSEPVAHDPNLPVSIQPLYYVRHPDDTYSVADPQPVQTTGGKGS